MPEELQLVSTSQFINGVGDYNVQIDEIFSENDYSIHVIKHENNRYLMDSITGAFDSYNNGGIYDLRELIDALSKFLDLSEMEFLARLTRR